MIRVCVFIGTRPEAVKLAPLVAELQQRENFDVSVCRLSQHKEMLDQTLRWFPGIKVDMDMSIMRENQGLADSAAAALAAAREAIDRLKPDIAVVQGDTTSALSAALAAFYAGVKVAHVEAGLRSGNPFAPWPEEANRTLISRLAALHFAPTDGNAENLRAEQVWGDIHVVGNTVIDALLDLCGRLAKDKEARRLAESESAAAGYQLREGRDFILATGHRRESFGGGLERICRALASVAEQSGLDVVYAVHLNPKVQETARRLLDGHPSVFLVPPLEYGCFVHLMSRSRLIMTDSGGIQEEAPSLDKPILVMRDETERSEVADCGAARLVGTDPETIVATALEVLSDDAVYRRMAAAPNPFGDGTACGKIADVLAAGTRATDR